ncbi:MAG: cell division protein SepF [Nanoarchaeota archaeon]
MVFDAIKRAFSRSAGGEDAGNEYLEIDLGKEEAQQKVFVKLFALKDYEEVTNILNFLREGYTIAVIDIKTLRQRDPIELKRAISKIKKTSDAMEGNIAGFGENVVIVAPSFAKIHKETMPVKEEKKEFTSRWD